MTSVFVAAGSNVEPMANLRRALDELSRHYPGLRCSRAYRNRALGFEGDDFVNLVLGFETDEGVHEVVGRLQQAEAACGRGRSDPRWAPRAIKVTSLPLPASRAP